MVTTEHDPVRIEVYCQEKSHPTKRARVRTLYGVLGRNFNGTLTGERIWSEIATKSARFNHAASTFKTTAQSDPNGNPLRGRQRSLARVKHIEDSGVELDPLNFTESTSGGHQVSPWIRDGEVVVPNARGASPSFKFLCELCGLHPQASQAMISPLLDGLVAKGLNEVELGVVDLWIRTGQDRR